MKKLAAIFMTVVIAALGVIAYVGGIFSEDKSNVFALDVMYGDINNDEKVNISDVVLALRAALAIDSLTEKESKAMDVDGNGKLDLTDVTNILKISLAIEDKFPIEEIVSADENIPEELEEIPEKYYSEAVNKGELVELFYDTYESTTYEQKEQKLNKRAIVYLPYGYNENEQYNVFYLMHGGWSNETTTLGTPNNPSAWDGKIHGCGKR